MTEPVLHLRSGQTRALTPPPMPVMGELIDCVSREIRDPAKQFRLATPDGFALDVPAVDIAGVELAPAFSLVRDFLAPEDMAKIEAHALAHRQHFADATLSLPSRQGEFQSDERFRQARILDVIDGLMPLIMPRLGVVLPQLWPRLAMAPPDIGYVECQLSAHGDGDFFMPHTDNGLPDIAHRLVSYVYYFHREPKPFEGGLLRFYTSVIRDGRHECGQTYAEIAPPRNGLMVFPSQYWHEVTKVSCPSGEFLDQRLTLNGWLCR